MSNFLPRGKSAATIVVVVAVSIGAVSYSHYQQTRDKRLMRAGVERDKERLREYKRQQREHQE